MPRMINADSLEPDTEWSEYQDGFVSYSQLQIDCAEVVDVLPISELRELRDDLYESDQITMNGLRKLNQLLARWETHESTD